MIAKSERMIGESLAFFLQSHKYQTIICYNEFEIEPLLKNHRPSVVMIGHDIGENRSMPLLISLRSKYPNTHFVLFTQQISIDDVLVSLSKGINGYLLFEDDIKDLLECMYWVFKDSPLISPYIRIDFTQQIYHINKDFRKSAHILKREAQNNVITYKDELN